MLVNGEFDNDVSPDDRAVAYGDGVFETIRLHRGRPIFLERHLRRLEQGARTLGFRCPRAQLERDLAMLEPSFADHGVLKIIVSRGRGGRGYGPGAGADPSRILSLHPLPAAAGPAASDGIDCMVCRQRLALQPALAGVKHLNRLEQVLASAELEGSDYEEGIMLDSNGRVIEGTRTNVFFSLRGDLLTPRLDACGVAGIMRQVLLESFGDAVTEKPCSLENLLQAEEVFVCNSVIGVWSVNSLTCGREQYRYRPGLYSGKADRIFNDALTER